MAEMKKQEIKDRIFQELAPSLAETGFRLKKTEDAYIRRIAGGRQMLGLPLWDYRPIFEFSLNICIRVDEVDAIFHLIARTPPKYQAMSVTTITTLEYFVGQPAKYQVSTPDEVTATCKSLSVVIREKIIPFFDQHTDVKSLDQAVNCQSPGIDISQPPWGAVHSIILAHLAGNPDFDRLIAKHRSELQLPAEAEHPFNRAVSYLKSN
jgi:hypothetical protein